MNLPKSVFIGADPKSWSSCLCRIFLAACLVFIGFFLWSAFVIPYDRVIYSKLVSDDRAQNSTLKECEIQCRPNGSEALPKGIVTDTSNLEMQALWVPLNWKENITEELNKKTTNLFAVAVGKKQKELVNVMVKKFLSNNFAVMLFHYDGNANEWTEFEWNDRVIHVSARNQTKWWFAKRFLHPDILVEYSYIFLWDEDLGVDNFHPDRYLAIVQREGLEISQPALEVGKSEVHHQITAKYGKEDVHRRIFKRGGHGKGCDGSSTGPPCTGWIEMMAPVFSKAAWRCAWYMVQNDLIHCWGLDMQLGYCAQGDRTKKVGVVDTESIIHYGLPTLGGDSNTNKAPPADNNHRVDVRRKSYMEFDIFKKRWAKAVEDDACWLDPYQQ